MRRHGSARCFLYGRQGKAVSYIRASSINDSYVGFEALSG